MIRPDRIAKTPNATRPRDGEWSVEKVMNAASARAGSARRRSTGQYAARNVSSSSDTAASLSIRASLLGGFLGGCSAWARDGGPGELA